MDSFLSALGNLKQCVEELQRGPWLFIRLRGSHSLHEAIDRDDVDLLGARSSIAALVQAAFGWVKMGRCHMRIRTGGGSKVVLSLMSTDGVHKIDLDLWCHLDQISRKRGALTFDGCKDVVLTGGGSIKRLPVDLEACIFIQHLLSKKKNASASKQVERLIGYADSCRIEGHDELARGLERTAKEGRVLSEIENLTFGVIREKTNIHFPSVLRMTMHRVCSAVRSGWMRPHRRPNALVFMGCDGSGKSTLSKGCATEIGRCDTYVGKHLYRKTLIYKALVIFVRPLLNQGRENFDDSIAIFNFIMACVRLRLKLLFFSRKRITIIDRSIMDFLVVERKTNCPRFSRGAFLSSLFAIQLPHVHFIVPFEKLKERKLEMTEEGHAKYNELMFSYFSGSDYADYIVFDNRSDLVDSQAALLNLLKGSAGLPLNK